MRTQYYLTIPCERGIVPDAGCFSPCKIYIVIHIVTAVAPVNHNKTKIYSSDMQFAYYNSSKDIGYKIKLWGGLGDYTSDGNFQRFVPYNTSY